ncbi:MAG: hypothetical protein NDJ89_03915 [Oligoflexia bacterium]|nr:hypothetical protein [Oligoflexia bacterium]
MRKLIVVLFLMGVCGGGWALGSVQRRPAKWVEVTLFFETRNLKPGVRVREVPVERHLSIGETGTLPLSAVTPLGREISPTFKVRRGDTQPFAVVVENPGDEPLFFFVNQHSMKPEEIAMAYKISCLCDSKIVVVPPRSRWYRIGNLSLSKYFPGDQLGLRHILVGLTFNQIKEGKLESLINQ